jgi:2'-hydroxyisoflavone reductase
MGDLIDACKRTIPNADTKLTWVPEDFLFKHWTKDEMGVPPWAPMGGDEPGFSLTPAERAKQAGLKIRPIYDSMRDTYEWFSTLPAERREKLRAGIDPQKEVETLRQWHEARQK